MSFSSIQPDTTGLPEEGAGDFADELLRNLPVGTIVDGKYRVDAVLGRGGAGIVVSATHVELNDQVALKFLQLTSGGKELRARFRREAQVSAKLKSEHITRVIDVGTWQGTVMFMVMEHLAGQDLSRKLSVEGRLPVPNAIDYLVQTIEGLSEAHAHGIVHRDLKPANLFLTTRPDGSELVKILDFGISKWSSSNQVEELTKTGVILGSPKYMAPEQLFGATSVDARADIWSLGAILYALLAGRSPYEQPTLTRIIAELTSDREPPPLWVLRDDVPKELSAAVMKCLRREPDERYADVAELAGSILEAVNAPFAGDVRARIRATLGRSLNDRGPMFSTGSYAARLPASESYPTARSVAAKRKRRALIAGVAAAVAIAAAVGVLALRSKWDRTEPISASPSTPVSAPTSASALPSRVESATAALADAAAAAASTAATAGTPRGPASAGSAPSRSATSAARMRNNAVSTATAAVTATATTAQVAPPAAPTTETPKKTNPLEDRQ